MEAALEQFISVFSAVPDPRADNARHALTDVLFIALAAVLCGAESCSDMAQFGEAKRGLLREVLPLEHGIPSHDTFSRVFRLLDPEAFEAGFRQFTAAFGEEISGVVAIDGKAVRGAFARGCKSTPLHLVNVWAAEQRLALAQRTAPDRNEVAGALEAIRLLSLDGCIVTADALHCHAEMAQAILDRDGGYVLALKGNQHALLADAQALLAGADSGDSFAETRSKSHDRIEQRSAVVVEAPTLAERHGFPGLKAVASVEAVRQPVGRPEQRKLRHFLLSEPLGAERLLQVVRTHWSIENQLHWVLDVVFQEDGARSRSDNGPQNLAILRKLALNMLRESPKKASLRQKVKRAGWDDEFLISLFAHMR